MPCDNQNEINSFVGVEDYNIDYMIHVLISYIYVEIFNRLSDYRFKSNY